MDATPTPARSHPSDIWVVLRGLEGVDDTLLEHPAFEYLLPLLEDREIPESAAWNGKTDVYVATDHRVIHLKTDFLQKTISTVTSYPYSDIRTFRAETGFMSLGCTMAMVIGDAKRLPMKPETRQRFATVVRSHVSAHQVPDVSSGFVPPLQSTASKPRRKKVWVISILGVLGVLLLAILVGILASGSSEPVRPSTAASAAPVAPAPAKARSTTTVAPVATQGILALDPIVARLSPTGIRQGSLTGWVLNDAGEECWFGQEATDDNSVSYFYGKLTGSDTLLVFEDQTCMTPSLPIGMDFHQRMVNQAIAAWYSKPDAQFMVHPHQLTGKGQLQVKGWCMQSATYPTQGVLIDYFVDNQSLVAVVHNYALGGCQG